MLWAKMLIFFFTPFLETDSREISGNDINHSKLEFGRPEENP